MKRDILFYFSLLKTSLKASMSKREAFLIESALMIANNLIFFVIWIIFFGQFQEVGGWRSRDMVALIAIGTGAYGLMKIMCGGAKTISRSILDGGLDTLMTQPKNVLLHLLGSKSEAKGWGHLMTSAILILYGRFSSCSELALIVLSIFSGMLVFTSVAIVAHSLPFWLGAVESLAKRYCDSLFVFALYPTNIYSGLLQLAMFTLIPAGVITFIPVELLRNFSWPLFATLCMSGPLFFSCSFWFFYRGLRRYESGNQFGARL